jgi:hypothetical protein
LSGISGKLGSTNEQDGDSKYEEDIDFDDLNRRFEALKRRK